MSSNLTDATKIKLKQNGKQMIDFENDLELDLEYLMGNVRNETTSAVAYLREVKFEDYDNYRERDELLYVAIQSNSLAESFFWEFEKKCPVAKLLPESKYGRFYRAYKPRIKKIKQMLIRELSPVVVEMDAPSNEKPLTEWEIAISESRFF